VNNNETEKRLTDIENGIAQVSKIAYEYQEYKKNKSIRIRNIIIIILLLLLIASNIGWRIYISQFEKVVETAETVTTTTTFEGVEQTTDNGGNNNIVGGDFVNGNSKD